MNLRHIKSIISNGIAESAKEKQLFDKDFSRAEDRISRAKSEMQARKKNRKLIRNR